VQRRPADDPLRRWVDDPADENDDEFRALSRDISGVYASQQSAVSVEGNVLNRLAVLGRLGVEPSPVRRKTLFFALQPVWRSIAGPAYQRLIDLSAQRWAGGRSPVAASATALGLSPHEIEPSLVAVLEAWRDGPGRRDEPLPPWDWWYAAGVADRRLRAALPLRRIVGINRDYYASLGADLDALRIGFDITPRPDRPPVPVAYTTFGSRPRRNADGTWVRARPWVLAGYTDGGLGELTELVHETGHAIHIAAIDASPADADWPDSDAFTEALAELTALDTAEPQWQQHWVGESAPLRQSIRGRYADVMLDMCWALLEIRLHDDPRRDPSALWAELTSGYLHIAAQPDLPWWAIRGQLVDEPGYMANYAIGPIVAADLRAAIKVARGDWYAGDTGWYDWVSERIYRYGRGRSSGDVVRDVLGRSPSAQALLSELSR
jgi:hypothetical protein